MRRRSSRARRVPYPLLPFPPFLGAAQLGQPTPFFLFLSLLSLRPFRVGRPFGGRPLSLESLGPWSSDPNPRRGLLCGKSPPKHRLGKTHPMVGPNGSARTPPLE